MSRTTTIPRSVGTPARTSPGSASESRWEPRTNPSEAVGLAAAVEKYLAGLVVPQGRYAGEPFTVLPWQSRFIAGAFKDGVLDSALSMGRGGGKTTFCAGLLAATVDLDGPLNSKNAESLLVASSFGQATIAFRHVLRMLAPTLERYPALLRVRDSQNMATIQNRDTGALLRCVGSDPRRLHGAAPILILGDELAQWPPNQIDRMLAALDTSRGKIPECRMLWIGTRPSNEDHPFEKMLAGGADYRQVHKADKGKHDPFKLATWRRANPSLEYLPDLKSTLKKEAARAKKDADKLASFEALRLNMGTADVIESYVLGPDAWKDILGQEAAPTGPWALGIDLGENAAMSAAAAYWPETGRLECLAVFPERPSLLERGQRDGVGPLYERLAARGELHQAGDLVASVPGLLDLVLDTWGAPTIIVCDTWREAKLRESLYAMNFPGNGDLELRRNGPRDGSEDLRNFRDACLSDGVKPADSLLLTSAIASARTITDASGNTRLATGTQAGRRTTTRDDALAAAILAVSAGWKRRTIPLYGRYETPV